MKEEMKEMNVIKGMKIIETIVVNEVMKSSNHHHDTKENRN
jgi:hypothetical protein